MSTALQKMFGSKLRAARLKRSLTQEELADKAGLHSTYLGQIERGRRNPSLNNIHRIVKALNGSIIEIFPD